MSNEATTWAQGQKVGNSPAKFVLIVLADYAGHDWSCYPSVKNISKVTEMGESTIRKALAVLTEQGLIKVFGRYRPDGSQRSSRYQLLVLGDETPEPDTEDWTYIRATPEGWVSEREGGSPAERPGGVSEREAIPLIDPSLKEPSPVVPRASRSDRGTRLPEDFMPDEKMKAWYAAENLEASISGLREHQKFMNYWLSKPGAAGRKTDWRRTWMNWMLSAAERAPQRPGNSLVPTSGAPQQYRSTTDGKVMQTMALAEKFRQMEENK